MELYQNRKAWGLFLIFALTLFRISDSFAQNELIFETVKDAGFSKKVFAIVKDKEGYVWFGTEYGLYRYDGFDAVKFEANSPELKAEFENMGIEMLKFQNDSLLWIGSRSHGGIFTLNIYNWKLDKIRAFDHKQIRAMYFDADSICWIGTDNGLFRYNYLKKTKQEYSPSNSSLSQKTIRAIYLDNDGNLWVGTEDKLNLLKKSAKYFTTIDLKAGYKPNIKRDLILDIKPFDPKNDSKLLIGSETGLYMLDRMTLATKTVNEKSGLKNEVVKTIYKSLSGEIFFGTDLGFYKMESINGAIHSYFHDPFNNFSIANNQVWNVYHDDNDCLWLATSNGINILKPTDNYFSFYPIYLKKDGLLLGTDVTDIIEYDKNYLVSSTNGVFLTKNDRSGTSIENTNFEELLSIRNTNVLALDQYNRVWIGGVAGIDIYDMKNKTFSKPKINFGEGPDVPSYYINKIIKAKNNNFYISTWGGLYWANASEPVTENIELNYVADFAGTIAEGKNNLWARYEEELTCYNFDTKNLTSIKKIKEEYGKTLYSICYAKNERIWLGSTNELVKYDIAKESLEIVKIPSANNFIVIGLIEDKFGNIWGCSDESIFCYNPSSMEFNFIKVPFNNPLKGLNFNPFRETREGSLLVCGFNGYYKIIPENFLRSTRNKEVKISLLKVNGQTVHPGKKIDNVAIIENLISNNTEIRLPYRLNNLEMGVSSLSIGNHDKEQYCCIFEGYDKSWRIIKAGTNKISYLNVPPGKYIFKVKAGNINDTGPITTLKVRILRPFFASIFMLCVYFILIVLIVAFIIRLRMNSIRYNLELEQMELKRKTDELLNSEKVNFYIHISHEMLNSVNLIIDPIRNISKRADLPKEAKELVKLIEKQTQFLWNYMEQMLNFRKIGLGQKMNTVVKTIELVSWSENIISSIKDKALQKEIEIRFISNHRLCNLAIDENRLSSILHNLLLNAVTYTHIGGKVTVLLHVKKGSNLYLEVKDNGPGIPESEYEKIFDPYSKIGTSAGEELMGIGLTIVREFVKDLGGDIKVESKINHGSKFKVNIPVQDNDDELENEPADYENVIVDINSIESYKKEIVIEKSSELPAILLIESNKTFYEYFKSTLGNKYNFDWCLDTETATKKLRKYKPSLIICEFVRDGDKSEFLQFLKKEASLSLIPLIAIAINRESDLQISLLKSGVDVILLKPIRIDLLEANIQNLLHKLKKQEEILQRNSLFTNTEAVQVDSSDDKLLKSVVEYVNKNISKTTITAEDVCRHTGVSHSHLYRKIKTLTGKSLNEFIRYLRLVKAEKLLATGKFNVAEVMYQVGFTNYSYFAKSFKELYNENPKNYAVKNR
jgi:ligand-binding sensor domain-containing protein/signal transduction histidine kinase/AraC-like DNA-binding protein